MAKGTVRSRRDKPIIMMRGEEGGVVCPATATGEVLFWTGRRRVRFSPTKAEGSQGLPQNFDAEQSAPPRSFSSVQPAKARCWLIENMNRAETANSSQFFTVVVSSQSRIGGNGSSLRRYFHRTSDHCQAQK